MSKPTRDELRALAEAGEAVRDDVVIESYVVDGNRLYIMDDGRVMDRFAKVRDYRGDDGYPRTVILEDRQGIQSAMEKAEKGVRGLLAVIGTPVAGLVGGLAGVDVPALRAKLVAFDALEPGDKVAEVLRIIGNPKAIELYEKARELLADGHLSMEDAAEFGASI